MYWGDNVIYIDTNVQIIPKEQPDKFICRLTIDCVNEKGDLSILKIVADGTVILPDVDEEAATQNNLIVTKLVYERTQKFVTEFKKISNMKFIDLPPFETIVKTM
ncbi:MAG: hypothetical protein NC452_09015 [Eubacterium sp.]|nr:hypothetical protein [Eubacterium sp.]